MLLDIKMVIKKKYLFHLKGFLLISFLFQMAIIIGRQWQLCQQWNTHNCDGYSVHKNLSALNIKVLQNRTRLNFNIYHSSGQKDLTCMLLKWNGKAKCMKVCLL